MLSWKGKEGDYVFPAFKFLSRLHADRLLNAGNVHLPHYSLFRDPDVVGGNIYDESEGSIELINHYPFFGGLAKDANGVLPLKRDPYSRVFLHNYECSESVSCDHIHIYCLTQYMLSESLNWALSEGKETCVMITDVSKFAEQVSREVRSDELEFVDVRDCLYCAGNDRSVMESNPGPNSLSNALLTERTEVGFIKRQKFAEQMELRAMWESQNHSRSTAVNRDMPSVRELCLPVDFTGINLTCLEDVTKSNIPVGGRIVKVSELPSAEFTVSEPAKICSPVIHQREGRSFLGFRYMDGRNIGTAGIEHADIGLIIGELGAIFCNVEMKEVKRIEFFHRT